VYIFGSTGVEFRALCFWGRCCTTWAMPPDFLVIFELGSHVFTWTCLDSDPLTYVSHIAGMTGAWHHARLFLLRWGFLFLPKLALNHDPLNLCSPSSWNHRCESHTQPIYSILLSDRLLWTKNHWCWGVKSPEPQLLCCDIMAEGQKDGASGYLKGTCSKVGMEAKEVFVKSPYWPPQFPESNYPCWNGLC
jgi:hypothetical protein